MQNVSQVDQIDHVEIFVPSRREAAEWYERILGLQIVAEMAVFAQYPGGPLMISSDGGNTKIALFCGKPQGDQEVIGLRRLAFRVDHAGFAAFLEHIEKHAVFGENNKRVSAEDLVDHETCVSIYFNDPWGTPLEVTSYDYEELASSGIVS